MKKPLLLFIKDITLDKIYFLITIVLVLGIPVFVMKTIGDKISVTAVAFLSLLLSTLYGYFMIFSKIGLIEVKYHATEYLLQMPIRRSDIILSKYILVLFIFILSILGYIGDYLVLDGFEPLSYSAVSFVFLLDCLFMGVYIPLEFKVGYENMKYYLMFFIVGMPLLSGGIGRIINAETAVKIYDLINTLTPFISVISLGILILSFFITKKIYEKKDI